MSWNSECSTVGSALDLGSRRRQFESGHSDQSQPSVKLTWRMQQIQMHVHRQWMTAGSNPAIYEQRHVWLVLASLVTWLKQKQCVEIFIGSVLKRSYEGCLENILSCKGHGRSNRSTSAKDAQLQSYLANIIDWKSMRCVVCPLLKVVQVHQMDMRLVFWGISETASHFTVYEVAPDRPRYTPPFRCKQQ